MKRLAFLIWLLMSGQVLAYGTAKEDTSTVITFVHSVGMDSVRYYASQDTTSWEINRLMARGFSPDSTNYVLIDTFDNPGTYWVKIVYWEGGADSSTMKVLPDIRHVAPANADVNMVQVSGSSPAADNLEEILDEDGVGADVEIDSSFNRTFVINNNSGTGTGLHIEGSGHGAWIKTTGSGTSALYADGSGGTNTHGLKAEGTGSGLDFNATLNFDDVSGDLETSHFNGVGAFWNEGKTGYSLSPGGIDAFFDEDTTGHGTAQSFAVLWKDTSAYQGAAAGITIAGIWNYDGISDFQDSTGNDQAGQYLFSVGLHNVGQNAPTVHMKLGTAYDGTEGSNVSDDFDTTFSKLDAMGAGTGEFACSLLVYDGSNYISPAGVRMVSGAQEFRVRASADGWAVFSLDGGTWTALVTALRFVQDTIPQTFTFSADYVDTLLMTAFSPSTPTDTGKVNLYIWTDRILGDILPGATFRVIPLDKGKNWVTGGGRILPLGEVTATTDSTGYAEIEVYQSSYTHPYPSGSDSLKYNISITYPGLSSWAQFRFVAPDSGNQYQIGVIE